MKIWSEEKKNNNPKFHDHTRDFLRPQLEGISHKIYKYFEVKKRQFIFGKLWHRAWKIEISISGLANDTNQIKPFKIFTSTDSHPLRSHSADLEVSYLYIYQTQINFINIIFPFSRASCYHKRQLTIATIDKTYLKWFLFVLLSGGYLRYCFEKRQCCKGKNKNNYDWGKDSINVIYIKYMHITCLYINHISLNWYVVCLHLMIN